MIHTKRILAVSAWILIVMLTARSDAQPAQSQGKSTQTAESQDRIWERSDIMIGFGGEEVEGKFTCPLYAPNGQPIPGATLTYDFSNVVIENGEISGFVKTTINKKGPSRDLDFNITLTEVAKGIAEQGGKTYMVGGGEIKIPDTNKTFIGRCKYEVTMEGGNLQFVGCRYCVYMIVEGLQS